MQLKEFLQNSSTIRKLPHDITLILTDIIYTQFTDVLEAWLDNPLGWYTFASPYDAFTSFREILIKNPPGMESIMSDWWNLFTGSTTKRGESLTIEINDFYHKYAGDTPMDKVPCFNAKAFGMLFSDNKIPTPELEYEDFFNKENKTSVMFRNLPRMSYFPYSLSKRRIIRKFARNKFFVKLHLSLTIEDLLNTYDYKGKKWNDYITELVIDKICNIPDQAL